MISNQLQRLADAISRGEDIRHADFEVLADEVGELRRLVDRLSAGPSNGAVIPIGGGGVVKVDRKGWDWIKGHAKVIALVMAGAIASHFPRAAGWIIDLIMKEYK